MQPPTDALKLQARDSEDLAVLSAMIQDAIVPVGDMAYDSEGRTFMMALNRFRWERAGEEPGRHERVHSGLRFDSVRSVDYRNIDRRDRGKFFSILNISLQRYDKKEQFSGIKVALNFSGNATIRLHVETLHAVLADLGEPWPTMWKPEHRAG